MPYHAKIITQSRHTGFSAALLATMAPCFTRRPRRTEVRPAPRSTLDVFAAFKWLGWCVAGPDGASATASFRNDGLTRPDWLAGAPVWGLEPALALVTHRERRRLQTTLYLTVRVPASTERWIVGASASSAIVLMHGEALSPQLDAAIPRLESAWVQLCPALPVWRDEAVPANERAGTRALLEQWRPVATLAARAAIPLACAAQTIFGPDGIY